MNFRPTEEMIEAAEIVIVAMGIVSTIKKARHPDNIVLLNAQRKESRAKRNLMDIMSKVTNKTAEQYLAEENEKYEQAVESVLKTLWHFINKDIDVLVSKYKNHLQ